MKEWAMEGLWEPELYDPSRQRAVKPRSSGLSMIMDKGLGLKAFEDLIQTGGAHIDFIKLGFGTAALYDLKVLQAKVNIAKIHDIRIYPGGTFLEVAVAQNRTVSYMDTVSKLGFDTIEISDGTVPISPSLRAELICEAKNRGFYVLTEYGKKLEGTSFELDAFTDEFARDLASGASLVIVEGRESGSGVGIYDDQGQIHSGSFLDVLLTHPDRDRIVWEAPRKEQQVELINHFGRNVNLGNIHPEDVFALEALRRGLRSDTLKL